MTCCLVEQPFTDHFPRAEICLAPDILHQLIKGVFKDHIVEWIEEFIYRVNVLSKAKSVIAEIDSRYVSIHSNSVN